MNSSQVLDVKRVLAVLEEQVFQSTGRYLTEVEKFLLREFGIVKIIKRWQVIRGITHTICSRK